MMFIAVFMCMICTFPENRVLLRSENLLEDTVLAVQKCIAILLSITKSILEDEKKILRQKRQQRDEKARKPVAVEHLRTHAEFQSFM